MTCKEKFEQEHPNVEFDYDHICQADYHYVPMDVDQCNSMTCKACWEQEIPDAGKIKQSTILDSGDRTQFETGAVRDMREGKGRCDLMPLEVVFRCYDLFARGKGEEDLNNADVFRYISYFQQTNDTEYLLRALDTFQGYDAWSDMFLEVAKHFEEGAKKYGPDNWRRGIPAYCYIDSAIRHYLKWLRGDKDEFHDRAFVWNLMCCIWEVDYHKGSDVKNGVSEECGEADNIPSEYPCTNCNVGWGYVNEVIGKSCYEVCERLANYKKMVDSTED